MAGMSTQLNFEADRPGVYKGENTQYNGKGFQVESFSVIARPAADYQRWVEGVRRAGQTLDTAALQRLTEKSVGVQAPGLLFCPPGLHQHVMMDSGGDAHAHPKDGR